MKNLVKFLSILATFCLIGIYILKKFNIVSNTNKLRENYKVVKQRLTDRQMQIMSLFVKNDELTNQTIHSKIPGVTDRTLRRDLGKLEKLNLIKKSGKTKGTSYIKL